MGKSDFLLRQHPRGSQIPWSEIPPILLNHEIPEFDIGKYKDLVNPSNNINDEIEDMDDQDNENDHEYKEDNNEIEDIIQDLSNEMRKIQKETDPMMKLSLSENNM